MDIDRFLNLGGLEEARQAPSVSSREQNIGPAVDTVLEAGEAIDRLGLQVRFSPARESRQIFLPECEAIAANTAAVILKLHNEEGVRLSRDTIKKSRDRQMRKAPEVAALLEAGNVTSPESMLLFDACGGAGHLSFAAHRLRASRGLSTRSVCVDLSEREVARFGYFKAALAPVGSNARFYHGDVSRYPFERGPERTVLLAKHACGPASEFLVDNVSALSPERAPQSSVVMTCCHGKCRELSAFDPSQSRSGFSREMWERLLVMSEWVGCGLGSKMTVGRVAMRIVDVLRTERVPDHLKAEVKELLPPHMAPKNHAICLQPSE